MSYAHTYEFHTYSYTSWHAWMDTHGIRNVFVTCTTCIKLTACCLGLAPWWKYCLNVSKEAPNNDGQEPKHYVPPVLRGVALGGGREGKWEGTTPWYHQQHIKVTALQCALLYRPSLETACTWNPSQLSTSQRKVHAGHKGTACTVSTA